MSGPAPIRVRVPAPADAPEMARVHVAGWRETYRGMMPDDILDAPDFIERRTRFWEAALADRRRAPESVAVAEIGGVAARIVTGGAVVDADSSSVPGRSAIRDDPPGADQ